MFLYRGRAGMLAMLSVLSLGNTQWDAPMFQILIPVRICQAVHSRKYIHC